MRWIVLGLLLGTGLLLFTITTVYGDSPELSQSALYNQAFRLNINGEYGRAAETYEKILRYFPETDSEDIYRELAVIYEERLMDFFRALQLYEKYFEIFPGGRLKNSFVQKDNFLKDNRSDWEVIKKFRHIKQTYYDRKVEENIKMMEELLQQNKNSKLVPDMFSWLAWEYHHLMNFEEGKDYLEKYLDTFPENGKPITEKIDAYNRYAVILTNLHQYREALNILKKAYNEGSEAFVAYEKKVYTVKKEWILWTGFLISVGIFILVLIIILFLKPWQREHLGIKINYLLRGIIIILSGTLLPMLVVKRLGYGIWDTFLTLAVVEFIVFIFINLLSPLARSINRGVFLITSLLLIIAGVYFSFYIWDTLSVFYSPFGY